MNEWLPLILAVGTLVLGGGGIAGYLQTRRKAPIEKKDADLAGAKLSQDMALEAAARLDIDVARLSTELKETRSELITERKARETDREQMNSKIEAQGRRVNSLHDVVQAYRRWSTDLVTRWDYWRQQDEPPTPPAGPTTGPLQTP